MPPGHFWDMTLGQLLTLADEHQAAHQTGGTRPTTEQSGTGLLELAHMGRI
ncbi:hypothetical protein ACFWNK_01775 [Streptomyces sp. NPDC058417]|uniref:hypothetical protein n=1 Tax=unclassified Streptomyces TaxID=2593676 RepID=UPI003647B5A9